MTQNPFHKAFIAAILLAGVAATNGLAQQAVPNQGEDQLIAVLQSPDAPKSEKAITCKRLAIYGSKKAVPALQPLLADNQLSSWARIALEAIPDSSADDALRESMDVVEGRLLVGVINSIGVRRDAKSVDVLINRLRDEDAQVASAAAVALGHIGNRLATARLIEGLTNTPASVRSAVATGCILSAEKLLDSGNSEEAAKLYDKVRTAEVPKQRIFEATRGAILARGAEGIPLLVQQLRSPDKEWFGLGLRVSREIKGEHLTKAIANALKTTQPDRQAYMMLALADRDDDAVLPTILQSAQTGNNNVRSVAVEALGRVGDASCLPTLLEAAIEDDKQLSDAAMSALQVLSGDDIDQEVVSRLPKVSGKMKTALIALVGLRRIDAVPALIAAADDADAEIRAAALTALGATVGSKNLKVLISRAISRRHPQDLEVAKKALLTASIRMPDRDDCANQLASAMANADVSTKIDLLQILGNVGGTAALKSVGAAAAGRNEELKDTASQMLGKWMTADAAPVLLELAQPVANEKYRIRALRGYARIARQFKLPHQERAEMCRNIFKTAGRDAEKKLAMQVLERYPSLEMLSLAVDSAKDPVLKNEASRIALAIAHKIGGDSQEVQKLLAQIGQEPVKVEIIKAVYGAGSNTQDVTKILQKHVGKLPIITLPSASFNTSFGGDPAPGTSKQLKVEYKINGTRGEASFPENALILLPVPDTK